MEKIKIDGRKVFFSAFIFLLMFFNLACTTSYSKDIDVGMNFRDGDLRDFYFSLSDYYRVPVRDVYILKERYPFITYEELPVLFFIVKEARVEPDLVIKYRKVGYSWFDVMIKFGLHPDRVYERYIIVDGPPYGKAWGYHKKNKNKVVVYRDIDIIELSNIKFITDYYHERPEVVVDVKKKHAKYIDVHREIHHKHKEKEYKEEKNKHRDRKF